MERFTDKIREKFRKGRGRNLKTFLASVQRLLRGLGQLPQRRGNEKSI